MNALGRLCRLSYRLGRLFDGLVEFVVGRDGDPVYSPPVEPVPAVVRPEDLYPPLPDLGKATPARAKRVRKIAVALVQAGKKAAPKRRRKPAVPKPPAKPKKR